MRTHYGARQRERLLRDFDKTAALVRPFVTRRYGEESGDSLYRRSRENYEEFIPQIPRIRNFRGSVLNGFLRVTAQEVAVYRAFKERGGTPAEAWAVCHEAIRLKMLKIPNWKRRLGRKTMFSRAARRVFSRRQQRGEVGQFGDFEIHYLTGDGSDFDVGIDYSRCGNLELAKKLGAPEFAPYVCMSDIAFSDALGWGLIRTQTLADGRSHCDFRFKKDANTQISSKTAGVQETIERIGRCSLSSE
jgi:hypothetical protein